MSTAATQQSQPTDERRARPTLAGHLAIARIEHWVKNVFVLPGIVAAVGLNAVAPSAINVLDILLALLAVGLVASSNYVVNEVLDAPFDATHPVKRLRPVPAGQVSIPLAYVQWLVLGAAGIGLGAWIAPEVGYTLGALWVMGCVYNIPPVRTKDVPYLDVTSEAINNPLRMLVGWYAVHATFVAPASLLVSYWMVGCFFMAIKRYSELRHLLDKEQAIAYRKSFAHYTTDRLLVSIMFYAAVSMLCFGAFIMRYRAELLLAFPLVALVMALYLRIGFDDEGAAQAPEKLYRARPLMIAVTLCTALMAVLLLVDIPVVGRLIAPTEPAAVQQPLLR
jgi:decaprenyl-phosphate phosphoribosyltransferase